LSLILLASLCVASCQRGSVAGNEIQYRGETFKLTKNYATYEDYKDDPDNLDIREVPRIEKLMTQAKIGPEFKDWGEFVKQAFEIKFPGYAFGGGQQVTSATRQFLVEDVEIPRAAKSRIFVLERMDGGRLRLVDDFVLQTPDAADSGIRSIEFIDDELRYADGRGAIIRRTGLSSDGG
jgi:hypothetical protein